MQLTYDKNLNNICQSYIKKLVNRYEEIIKNNWEDDIYTLLGETINYIVNDGNDLKLSQLFEKYAEAHDIKNLNHLFEGNLKQLPQFLLGEEWADLFFTVISLESEWPYTIGYFRRSVRGRDIALHSMNLVYYLRDFTIMKASGFQPEEWLIKEKDFSDANLITNPLFAALIKKENKKVIEYFKNALSGNADKELTWDHFRAIVRSGNEELLKLEGSLLLSSGLQEGLRQAIIETADEGLPESYVYIITIVKNNNLQRFASVKRGIAVTTGLEKSDSISTLTQIIYEYLTDDNKRLRDILSDNPLKVYMALWAIAFYNVDHLKSPLENILNKGDRLQIETAMILLSNIGNFKISSYFAAKALRKYHEDMGIIAGALPLYLGHNVSISDDPELNETLKNNAKKEWEDFFPSTQEALEDFEILGKIYYLIKKKITYEPYVFTSERKELTKDMVASKMCEIAEIVNSPDIIDRVIDYINGIDSLGRGDVIKKLLTYPTTQKQIDFLIESIGNTSLEARNESCKIVERLFIEGKLGDHDYNKIEKLLKYKYSETRIACIKILSQLSDVKAHEVVNRLISDKIDLKRLAGLEILKQWSEKKEKNIMVNPFITTLKENTSQSPYEKQLINEILNNIDKLNSTFNFKNGFGLYDPNDFPNIEPEWPSDFNPSKELTFEKPEEGIKIMEKLMALIENKADLTFQTSWGEIQRIGNSVIREYNNNSPRKMKLGYPEIWMKFYKDEIKTTKNLLRLVIPFYFDRYIDIDKAFKPVIKKFLGNAFNKDAYKKIEGKRYFNSAQVIILNLYEYLNDEPVWETLVDLYSDIATRIKSEEIVREEKNIDGSSIKSAIWLEAPLNQLDNVFFDSRSFNDTLFKRYFSAMYSLFRKSDFMNDNYLEGIGILTLYPHDFLRAWEMGILTDRHFMQELMGRPYSHYLIKYFTSRLPKSVNSFSAELYNSTVLSIDAQIILNQVIERILNIELKRGSTPTEVSYLAKTLKSVIGIDNFIGILIAFDKEKFNIYTTSTTTLSKRDILSQLLLNCCPSSNDSGEKLRNKVKEVGISDERLVEAAVYSPLWLELVEEAIGWKGLTSAAYYFHAHSGTKLNEFIKSRIRRFSIIPPEDFSDGAFDLDWFRDVYEVLGEKRFQFIYEASKYISVNNRHIRSRKLSDAALGRVSVKEIISIISEKRDKDWIVAFGLVPLKNKDEIQERYLFLNSILKAGKKSGGAQRRSTEERAVTLSLDNLARNAGYTDSTRLTWIIESDLVEKWAEFLLPKNIDGITFYVKVSEGIPELVIENNEKTLRNIPSSLKKNSYILKLIEVYNTFKEQYVRGRSLLENSMITLSEFLGEEIMALNRNPIIWKMLSHLILIKNNREFGFLSDDGKRLINYDEKNFLINPEDTLRIAHPYDLYKHGIWSDFQKIIYDKQKRQPFKQAFRELYIPTIDEQDKTLSNRYSGNQINAHKAIGVLKSRGWVTDYEFGLQKTSFTHNVITRIYAMADWFSPADIEPPVLEYIEFIDRRTGKPKIISEINPVLFSETMRDIDLVLSVAHSIGTDPETSHSTMEMRKVVAQHSTTLFNLKNVTVNDNFIKINGTIADYNIHLGSGLVHQEGGAEIDVLPVHSQTRGRIFLPFIDDDPKTAEIITKMLFFSEDYKIKDPSILRQINRTK